jgi:hypothetical protein
MLNNRHFYHGLMRKYIMVFGNMFKDIKVLKWDSNGNEIERIQVPIIMGSKENWLTRLESDPDLFREMGLVLPRMSFELKNMTRDLTRAQNPLLRVAASDTASKVKSQYMGVPYDYTFELSIYARTHDHASQIVEQILPHFNPDYTVPITPVPEIPFLKDIPIILNSVTPDVKYEGEQDAVRYINWTMEFTLKGYFYGPYTDPKIIRKVFANIWNDPSLVRGHVIKMNLTGGSGNFIPEDTVYYSTAGLNTAKAFGYVNDWNAGTGRLTVGGAQGDFEVGQTIRAASTNAIYTIESFDATPLKLVEIKIEPDPIDAMPDDDFGFTTTITEWPDTEE